MTPEFLHRFVVDSTDLVTALRDALSTRDLEEAALLAHTLIGSAGIVGARAMAEAAHDVQEGAAQDDFEATRHAYESLVVEFERAKSSIVTGAGDDQGLDGRIRPTSTSQV